MYAYWKLSVCACVLLVTASSVSTATAQGIYHWDRTSQSSQASSGTEAQVEPGGTYDSDTDASTTPSANLVSSSTSSSSSGAGGSTSADGEGECELNTDGQAILKWEFSHEVTGDIALSTWASGSASAGQATETDTYVELDHPNPPPGQATARVYVDIQWGDTGSYPFLTSRDMNMSIRIGSQTLSLYVDNGYLTASCYFPYFFKQSATRINSDSGSFRIDLNEFVNSLSVGDQAHIVCNDPVESQVGYLYNTANETWSGNWTGSFSGTIEVRVDN